MNNSVTKEDVDDWLDNCCVDLIAYIKESYNSDKNKDDAMVAIKELLYYPMNNDDIVEYVRKKGASDEIIKYAEYARKQKESELIKIVEDFFRKESLN